MMTSGPARWSGKLASRGNRVIYSNCRGFQSTKNDWLGVLVSVDLAGGGHTPVLTLKDHFMADQSCSGFYSSINCLTIV